MQKVNRILICVFMMSLFYSTGALAQCKVDEPGFHPTFQSDPNVDLDDYGRIFVDADDPNCAQHAHDALYTKIYDSLHNYQGILPHPVYQQWLDGYKVSLAFAAAERIGRNGWASQALDDQLTGIEGTFVPREQKAIAGGRSSL